MPLMMHRSVPSEARLGIYGKQGGGSKRQLRGFATTAGTELPSRISQWITWFLLQEVGVRPRIILYPVAKSVII